MSEMNQTFYPIQPEISLNCLLYEEYVPKQEETKEVSLFYQFQTDERLLGALPVMPDGCLDILFCFHSSRSFAVIATSPEVRCSYSFQQNAQYFAVRFFPGQQCLPLRCSMKELIQHQQLPLKDVLQIDCSLLENLVSCGSFPERVQLFLSFLNTKRREKNYHQNLIIYCLHKIYSTEGILNIKQLARETGYTDRYLRQRFETTIGFSPKQFSQIVRLQHAVQQIVKSKPQLDHLVDDYEFYDKAHFYKIFKKYMSMTPHEYRDIFQQETRKKRP